MTSSGTESESLTGPPPEAWDEELAGKLRGATVLVGLTRVDAGGELIEQTQFFGDVRSVDRRSGILLDLRGQRAGQQYNLPPDTRPFDTAKPGEYKLRSTGETVTDPDYLCTWTIQEPRH